MNPNGNLVKPNYHLDVFKIVYNDFELPCHFAQIQFGQNLCHLQKLCQFLQVTPDFRSLLLKFYIDRPFFCVTLKRF